MIEVPTGPFQLQAGPIEVDSNRLGPELLGLAGILLLLLVFKLGLRLIGKL